MTHTYEYKGSFRRSGRQSDDAAKRSGRNSDHKTGSNGQSDRPYKSDRPYNKDYKQEYEPQNIADFVDFEGEYSHVLDRAKKSGSEITGRCPFHDDNTPSFSANIKTGQFICHGCQAKGNFITFIARLNGWSTKDAYIEILKKYNRFKD